MTFWSYLLSITPVKYIYLYHVLTYFNCLFFKGENRFIESICQTIFKIPELLKVLNNPNISDNLKRPFLRFFLWVYLNTASGMIESGAGDIPHDP